MPKKHTWRSWTFYIMAILVTLLMFGLDLVAVILGEWIVPWLLILILVGYILSIVFSVITLKRRQERKLIPIISLAITLFNLAVGGLFYLAGTMLSNIERF